MNPSMLRKYKYVFGVFGIILVLVVYKFRFLALPYYWDEAIPYSMAVRSMQLNGLSLMPGSIPADLSRGHPLMFHFLSACWMKIFGTSLLSGHSFTLFVAAILLFIIYRFGKEFFSERVGFISCLLFAAQPAFIVESVFLLPEMLLALWVMLCLFYFFKRNNMLFIVSGSALLLTKESGIVLFIAIGFSEIAQYLHSKNKNLILLLKRLVLVTIPIMIASLFFIFQKIKFGWFLYPLHTDYIKDQLHSTFDRAPDIIAYFFLYYGRNGICFFLILSIILLLINKIKLTENEKKVLSVFGFFIFFFLVFSCTNFYIPRYLLCAFPPFIIIATVLIDKIASVIRFRGKTIVYSLLITGFVITGIFYYVTIKNGDNDYSPAIKADLQAINYCEKENLYNEYIFTTCVLHYGLTEPYLGFLSNRPFSHIESQFTDKTQYCIFPKDEYDAALFDRLKGEHHLQLLKRFEDRSAWVELYKVDQR